MKDFINRQAAIDELIKWADGYRYIEIPTDNAIDKFEKIPTADVVEVVRCRDCIKHEYCRTSNTWAVTPNDDWFCADGERRTDGEIH